MVELRLAAPADAASILHIYAPYILDTAITFENTLPSIAEVEGRIRHYGEKFPWILCSVNGRVAGYAYANPHRDREAYQWTTECSIYLDEAYKGLGIGMELYGALFPVLKMQGVRNVYAGITLPNHASVRLHEKCGFAHFATYDHVGYKLGRWHKVGWWGLVLNAYENDPPPPLKFSAVERPVYQPLFEAAARRIASRIND